MSLRCGGCDVLLDLKRGEDAGRRREQIQDFRVEHGACQHDITMIVAPRPREPE